MGRFKQNDKYKRILISHNNKVFYAYLYSFTIIFPNTGEIDIENLIQTINYSPSIMHTFRYKNIQYYVYDHSLFVGNVVLIDRRNNKLTLYNTDKYELISDIFKELLDYLRIINISLYINHRSKKNNIIVNHSNLVSISRKKRVLTAALALL